MHEKDARGESTPAGRESAFEEYNDMGGNEASEPTDACAVEARLGDAKCACKRSEGGSGSGGASQDGVDLGENLFPLLGRVREVRDRSASAKRQICMCGMSVNAAVGGEGEGSRRTTAALDERADDHGPVARAVDGEEPQNTYEDREISEMGTGRLMQRRTRVGVARDVPLELVEELQAAELGRARHRACRVAAGSVLA